METGYSAEESNRSGNSLRFNIKQMLLLFVLLGLIGGLLSSVIGRAYRTRFDAIAVSGAAQDSNSSSASVVALANSKDLLLVDMAHSRLGSLRKIGLADVRGIVASQMQFVHFLDDDNLIMLRENFGGFREMIYYSVRYNRIDKQVVLTNWDSSGERVVLDEKTLTVRKEDRWVALYDLASGKRIKLNPKMELGLVTRIRTNTDGTKAGLIRKSDDTKGETAVEVWDLKNGEKIGDWTEPARDLKFVPGTDDLIVSFNRTLIRLDSGKASPVWRRQLETEIDPDFVRINAAGDRIVIGDRGFTVVDAIAGNIIKSIHPSKMRPIRKRLFRFIDDRRIALAIENSDRGLEVVDIESGRIKSTGRFCRWPVALLFSFLFIGWSWIWGRIAKHEEQQLLVAHFSHDTAPEIHALDAEPASDAEAVQDDSELEIVQATIVDQTNPGSPDRKIVAWNMMAVGGIFAIFWSVIPMFFFGADGVNELFHSLYFFRLSVAVFGLVVGLMATCRGIGRYENWMNLTAGLQVLNLIGFDLLNAILGMAELALLNKNKPLQAGQLAESEASRNTQRGK